MATIYVAFNKFIIFQTFLFEFINNFKKYLISIFTYNCVNFNMNNTNFNKTKKKKYNTNKTTETEVTGAAPGHSLQKRQQQEDEENIIKKKLKLKQKSKKKSDNIIVENDKPQDENKLKKKPKQKDNLQLNTDIAVTGNDVDWSLQEPQQQQNENKLKKNLKQKENKQLNTDVGRTETNIGQLPQEQLRDENKINKNLKQKENLQLNTDIENSGNDINPSQHKPQHQQNENKINKKLKQKENLQLKSDIGVTENDMKVEKTELSSKKKSKIKENFNNTDIEKVATDIGPPLQVVQEQQDVEYYHKKVYMFMKTLKRDYKHLALIYNSCIKSEQERQKRNEEEIDQLKKRYNQLQVEKTDIKRKRWCRYCESEATYLSTKGTNFYCSIECEEKQNDLVNVMEEVFKS